MSYYVSEFRERLLRFEPKIQSFFKTSAGIEKTYIEESVIVDDQQLEVTEETEVADMVLDNVCQSKQTQMASGLSGCNEMEVLHKDSVIMETNQFTRPLEDHMYSNLSRPNAATISSQPTLKQMLLNKPICEFCSRVNSLEDFIAVALEPMKQQHCHCRESRCCCELKIDELHSRYRQLNRDSKAAGPTQPADSVRDYDGNFYYRKEPGGTVRYFCCKCTRYGQNVKADTASRITAWVESGKVFEGVYQKHQAMSRHLTSQEHIYSLEVERKRLSER